jgi:hypothetical protein
LYSPNLTGHLEWAPNHAANDGIEHRIASTDIGASSFLLRKHSTDTINLYISNTLVISAALAAFGSYWVTNGRNLLSFSCTSGTSGANALWLNGVEIATSATAWAATNPSPLYVGSRAGVGFAGGVYYRLYIGHHTSTLAEHTAYWTNSMFSWRNRLTVDLPFGIGQYDPDNKQTLDVSGHDNHATLGDGAGTGEPTQGRGFLTLDGVNDYLSGIANPAGSYTVLGYEDTGTGWTFFSNNDLTKWTPIMTSGGFTGKLGHLAVAPEVLNATQLLDAAIQLRQYGSEV